MRIYEVGGAIRDDLLGIPVQERDWVVVGGTPQELLRRGYRRVGKDFPVFLHPESKEEYALARTERKTGPGHTGFAVHSDSDVTLEEDLRRRDLTINAIARDASGELIDPYGGVSDLRARLLRHVSDAFREDPLRVLRVARFAAKLHEHGFTVAIETQHLMLSMVESGELGTLQPERVWGESAKALSTSRPDVFFEVLRKCGALATVFPEVDRLFGVPQPPQWHPEIDTGVHTLMALRVAAELTGSLAVRFAVLTHDLGKGRTPEAFLPRHPGHEARSVECLDEISQRLPIPRKIAQLAKLVARHHGDVHRAHKLSAKGILKLLSATDAVRQADRFSEFLTACEADARGRLGLRDSDYRQSKLLLTALEAVREARTATVGENPTLTGRAVGEAIRRAQLSAIEQVIEQSAAVTEG